MEDKSPVRIEFEPSEDFDNQFLEFVEAVLNWEKKQDEK